MGSIMTLSDSHYKRVASRENKYFAYAKTKAQISFAVAAKLISAFVFRYTDSTIPLLSISKMSILFPSYDCTARFVSDLFGFSQMTMIEVLLSLTSE